MEKWQKKHIQDNLPDLIEMTRFDELVLALLLSERILSKGDISGLEATKITRGQHAHSSRLYDLLLAREYAYEKLAKALFKTNQSGALKILLMGFTKAGIRASLTLCGIPVDLDDFENTNILAYGSQIKVKQYFPTADTTALQKIFYETLPGDVYFEKFIQNKEFELFNNTIPPEPAFYFPRFISNRTKINKDVFKSSCVDIFVFKGITRHDLTLLASPNNTALSKNQLECVTSRFIHLDRDEDWKEILQVATVPVHLIKFESDGDLFILENTSKMSDILLKFCSGQGHAYVTEDTFMKQRQATNYPSSGVCICDTPGMGKTMLLGNLARSCVKQHPERITAFIGLTSFLEHVIRPLPNIDQQPTKALWYLLNYITPTNEHINVIKALVENGLVRVYLFFDGFDEITSEEVEWMKKIFNLFKANFNVIDIYVSSRPHMRRDLESSLNVVAYDMLPFNFQNRVNFLVNYWLQKFPGCNKSLLNAYALRVLKTVKVTVLEEEIAGIPLLCGLIASVYANEAKLCISSDQTREIRCSPRSICGMYEKFMEMKINSAIKQLSPSNDEVGTETIIDRKRLKMFFVWKAWQTVCPGGNCFEDLEDIDSLKFDHHVIYKIGIMEQQRNRNTVKMQFVHGTFALFLLAEYLVDYLLSSKMSNPKYDVLFAFIFKRVLNSGFYFQNPFLVYFFNSLLKKGSELGHRVTENQFALFNNWVPALKLYLMFCHCSANSYTNIFYLLKNILLSWGPNIPHQYSEFFTKKMSFLLIECAIMSKEVCNVHQAFELASQVFGYDMIELCHINTNDKTKFSLLQTAVYYGRYEAVEFLIKITDLKNQDLLGICAESSYETNMPRKKIAESQSDFNIFARASQYEDFCDEDYTTIFKLLLKSDTKLFDECPNLLMTTKMSFEILKTLINFGAPMESTNPEVKANCITFAATYMPASDFHNFLEFLIYEYKAEYLFHNYSITLPIIFECQSLLPETFEMLLNIPGLDPNMMDKCGHTLAHHAVLGNHLNSLKMLVQRGVNYKYTYESQRILLHFAAALGWIDIITYLISLGLDVNHCDEDGNTPIWLAARFSTLTTVTILFQHGADRLVVAELGRNLLHAAALAGNLDVISYCLNHGFNIDLKDIEGDSPILLAAAFSNVDTTKLLVEQGANFNLTNKIGANILHKAANQGNIELAEYCIKLGLDPNSRDTDGRTPMMHTFLTSPESNKMIQFLISIEADYTITDKRGLNILHTAAMRGDETVVKLCIELGLDPNQQTKDGSQSPISLAVIRKNLAVIPALVEGGANCNFVNKFGQNILHQAVQTQDLKIVEYCLNIVSNIDQQDNLGCTPVLVSSFLNDLPTVRYLIEKGADYNQCSHEGYDVPLWALAQANMQLLLCLLNLGWNPNKINTHGENRLFMFASNRSLTKFKGLVAVRADVHTTNNSGENLLHTTARTNNVELLRYLISKGLPVNQQDVDGNAPIMMASLFGDIHSVWTLIESGADYKLTNINEQSIFHNAARRANEKLVMFCMYIGMDPNQGDIYGNTPLLLASQSCSPEIIRQMIHFGAVPTITNHENQTILHIAARNANFHLIELCIELGFDANQRDKNGDPPIFLAVKYADINTVLCMVVHGADVYATNRQGQSILHIAAEKGNVGLVNYCLCQGLNPNQKDNNGDTPLFLAAEFGDVETVHMLITYGANYNSVNKYGQNVLQVAADWLNEELVSYCVNVLFIGKDKSEISPFRILQTGLRPPSGKKLRVVLKCQNDT